MDKLPVVDKTKLNKDQTYFVSAEQIRQLLDNCKELNNISLNFSDDPSRFKSNYDRFVKSERKLVVMSCRFTPSTEEVPEEKEASKEFRISVYAVIKAIREDLIAQFEETHYATLKQWLDEPRDRIWKRTPHAILFLIDIDSEQIEVAYDIDFGSYARHPKKQKFRTDTRRH